MTVKASSSQLNMVEIFFSQLTDKALRRGIFHSVTDLIEAIQTYVAAHNQNPEPFQYHLLPAEDGADQSAVVVHK